MLVSLTVAIIPDHQVVQLNICNFYSKIHILK